MEELCFGEIDTTDLRVELERLDRSLRRDRRASGLAIHWRAC